MFAENEGRQLTVFLPYIPSTYPAPHLNFGSVNRSGFNAQDTTSAGGGEWKSLPVPGSCGH